VSYHRLNKRSEELRYLNIVNAEIYIGDAEEVWMVFVRCY